MHNVQTIAIDDHRVCVSPSDMWHRCAVTAERIKVLFGLETLGDSRNIVLNRSPNFPHGLDLAFTKSLWLLVHYCLLWSCLFWLLLFSCMLAIFKYLCCSSTSTSSSVGTNRHTTRHIYLYHCSCSVSQCLAAHRSRFRNCH